jgi:tetratricopeptide (TPR) repeat protein
MPESTLEDTQPSGALHETQPNSPAPVPEKRFPGWLVALCVVLIIGIGLLAGYDSGMGRRFAAQNTAAVGQLAEQFELGNKAIASGNYELARQYFEGVLRTNSNYPGIQAAYTDLLVRMHANNSTPQYSPTPYLSPTPDLRGADQIYNTALQLLNSGDWDSAISNLDSLRKSNPTYHTAQVDGMYYMALRQRGVGKITAACQNTNLEGGIYDLTLAEHFVGTGNLDSVAESLRTYARLYIIAASFWDQDWLQAQNFFAQAMTGYPNMSDSSCKSATTRWVEATINLANQLLAAGDACGAEAQLADAFQVNNPLNATVYPTATAISNQCNGNNPAMSETPTLEGTPSGTLPLTPTSTTRRVPTRAPTEIPSETPTPTLPEVPTATAPPTCDSSSGTPCP